ncbi:MAG TPA: ABC transporter permease [Bacteroidales bacterium]|nr:MAG: hypothetical protein A2W98_10955 [Bacteroidetes bacterium GWF2_33_38]OFY76582.1 MAG: hypothetical protein A2265_11100 [Bacteroidetes bacterium RIFOXYA12_FULL_33_9]HBF88027.1 ABC transporter permease [Bacteroidales bacterium]
MINSISWKNIWRNKLRSLVIITAIAFGVMAGVFSAAMTNGMFDSRIASAIELESSNIQIHNSKYLENKESYYFIENADSILEVVKQNPNVKSASKRIKITAMANTSASGAGVMLYGIEPDIEKNVTKISEKIADSLGTYFKAKSKNQIVISSKLAEKLKVKLKSKIVLTVQSLDGTMVNSAFKVVGIFKTSNSAFDEMTVFVKYQDIANIINLDATKAHEIAILLKENQKSDEVATQLKSKFKSLNVMTWKEIQPEVGMVAEMLNFSLYIFMIIILFALGFGIVNTMLMVVLERVKEIGMLMAIGMNRMRVFKMIMLETVYLSLTGGVVGMILGAGIINFFGKTGIDLSIYAEGLNNIGYASIIYPSIGFDYYINTVIMVILTGIIASLYPARKALKLNPAEAVRTEI